MFVSRVVVPLVAAYALFLGVVVYSLHRPVPRPGVSRPFVGGWVALLRHVTATAAGGYALFVLVVLVFHVAIAGQRGAMRSALWGGAFLAFCAAIPAFVLLSWIAARVRRG